MAVRYAYWVNYGIGQGRSWGEGSIEVILPHRLVRGDQVTALARDLASQQKAPSTVIVRTFQLLREE